VAPELLTPDEVAARLKVAVETVHGWLRRGELAGRKLGRSRLWRVDAADVEAFAPPPMAPRHRRRGRSAADVERRLREMGVA
jgi:excisionase family DNA binding protein